MKEIKELFKEIGKEDITEFHENLISTGIIDSLDMMNLIATIENKYNINIGYEDITQENFENFTKIKEVICKYKS